MSNVSIAYQEGYRDGELDAQTGTVDTYAVSMLKSANKYNADYGRGYKRAMDLHKGAK